MPTAVACFALTRNLGQDLFAPPNVKGWDGGLSWITTNNLLSRYNEAATLVNGDMSGTATNMLVNNPNANKMIERRLQYLPAGKVDPGKLFTEKERANKEALIAALERRLLQDKLKPKQEATLRDYLEPKETIDDAVIMKAIRLVMSTPEFQVT